MIKFLFAALIAMVVLTACQPASPPAPQTVTPSRPTDPTPTATLTVVPSATVVPTVAPTASPTPVPTVVPTAQPTPTPTTLPALRVQVNSPDVGYVNVRSSPATSGELVTQAQDQSTLDVIEAADVARDKVGQQGQWLKIRTPDGKEGFVAAWYVRLPGTSSMPVLPTPAARVSPTAMPNPKLDVVVELLNRTNALRAENGLPSYKLNDMLNASAQRHSDDMASTGSIVHAGADGSSAKQRVLDTGYKAQFVGENIFGGQVTVDDVWNFWSTDPDHRAVLLNSQYVDIGISVVKGKGGWYFFTMDVARPSA